MAGLSTHNAYERVRAGRIAEYEVGYGPHCKMDCYSCLTIPAPRYEDRSWIQRCRAITVPPRNTTCDGGFPVQILGSIILLL
jgi:hypothetical protein